MKFWLGAHNPSWLETAQVPLMVSMTRIFRFTETPQELRAAAPWVLDSGAFTEIDRNGRWLRSPEKHVQLARWCRDEIGNLEWVSPQDWMCEERMLAKTGLSVRQHQYLTLANFIDLKSAEPSLFIPVLQGFELDDYLRHVELYASAGIDLEGYPVVGLGTVCRRQATQPVEEIVRGLTTRCNINLHGFGVKISGLQRYGDALVSSDSMAWSLAARMEARTSTTRCPLTGRQHCGDCLHYALDWRDRLLTNYEGVT